MDYALLKTLHRMLRQLTDIDDRMRRGPMKVKIIEQNEAGFETALAEHQTKFDELRRASNDKSMQLGEREAKIEDMKKKLNVCESNKEFQLLKDRIAADNQANSVLEDEIFELLERLDVATEEVATAKKNYAKSQQETTSMRDKVKLEIEELESEKTRVTGELAETEKKLPVTMMEDYRRVVGRKGEDTFATTNKETCDNCNMHLTTQMASNLMMKKLVVCPGCGSVLYTE